ncbi:hypothetical protein [Roseiconus lacunae]|uniref:Uncharacterized protein n=1 Tax=Roseiconus lacunae TaxID=2605694 RepID=A0ABT7PI16_9BACT|nr:hypothetical protein [Roseiconus lacunae]MDM4015826.1 hypothetical protein [Roseiconus lacunae]
MTEAEMEQLTREHKTQIEEMGQLRDRIQSLEGTRTLFHSFLAVFACLTAVGFFLGRAAINRQVVETLDINNQTVDELKNLREEAERHAGVVKNIRESHEYVATVIADDGSVAIDGSLNVTGAITVGTENRTSMLTGEMLRVRNGDRTGKIETDKLDVGSGGTAIEMTRDEIYMGYGGTNGTEEFNGRRLPGIILKSGSPSRIRAKGTTAVESLP